MTVEDYHELTILLQYIDRCAGARARRAECDQREAHAADANGRASREQLPGSPRLLKGGLVLVDPDTGAVLRVIALQYNPDTLTRTLQVQATRRERRRPLARRCGSRAPAVETIKLEAEIDATDQLERPGREPDAVAARHPPAARGARDARLPDAPTTLQANDALAGARHARDRCRSRRR